MEGWLGGLQFSWCEGMEWVGLGWVGVLFMWLGVFSNSIFCLLAKPAVKTGYLLFLC